MQTLPLKKSDVLSKNKSDVTVNMFYKINKSKFEFDFSKT